MFNVCAWGAGQGRGENGVKAVDPGKVENRSNQMSKVVFSENLPPRPGIDLPLLCFLTRAGLRACIHARNRVFVH